MTTFTPYGRLPPDSLLPKVLGYGVISLHLKKLIYTKKERRMIKKKSVAFKAIEENIGETDEFDEENFFLITKSGIETFNVPEINEEVRKISQ